ncbi:15091_t:CDS:1 [Acaulospora morrowiae]|uniref:15091_t:CDS:1 n=1 Tax=Acaulospora morrowiae TaxID=94023 RepID=A0A9N9C7R9_9GLOM|nr:15091_t:CDS:1 [Acaulospora morrowiae]
MPLKILVGTYNVNTQILDQDLSSWLFSLNGSSNSFTNPTPSPTTTHVALVDKPDIIALGFQEFSPMPYSLISTDTERLESCANLIERTIFVNTKESYTQLVKASYVGLALFIYTRDNSITRLIKNYEVSKAGVGPFWIGNKGGLGARILINREKPMENLKDISGRAPGGELILSFVVAHLAPHNHNVQKRNHDFRSICERLVFTNGECQNTLQEEDNVIIDRESLEEGSSYTPLMPRSGSKKDNQKDNGLDSSYYRDQGYSTIYDSDFLFFFGDLNYRIELGESQSSQTPGNILDDSNNNSSPRSTHQLTIGKLLNLLHDHQHHRVRSYDQLTKEVNSGKVLNGFEEGELNFLPTYKFHKGSEHEFDVSIRTPGWCDRIFYFWHKEGYNDHVGVNTKREEPPIKLNQYVSHPSYILSDHKPVSAFFTIPTLSPVSSTTFSSSPQNQLDSFPMMIETRPRTFNSPFKIDKHLRAKFLIGEISAKTLGSLWWLFGTKRGIEAGVITSLTFAIVWWMIKKFGM